MALQALKDEGTVDEDVEPADFLVMGPVGAVFSTASWASSKSPWYNPSQQVASGNRMFVQGYSSQFFSYIASTRDLFGISGYQFRAPGEWFAEAYACYYSDHDSTNGARPGTRLRTRDSATADWFDANVDNGHSLAEETDQTETAAPTSDTGS